MAALGAIPAEALGQYVVLGELNLDGTIGTVSGALPAAIGANALGKGLICPADSGPEAARAGAGIDILAPRSLIALANHFRGTQLRPPDARDPRQSGQFAGSGRYQGAGDGPARWRWQLPVAIIC